MAALGDTAEFQATIVRRVDGDGPCPNGCGRTSPRFEMLGVKVPPLLCTVCQAEADAAREVEERAEVVADKLLRSGLLAGKFAGYSVDSFPSSDSAGADALRRALAWSRVERKPNLFVFGDVGRGKTGLVVALLRKMVEDELAEVRLVNWLDYLERLRDSYGQKVPRPALFDRVPLLAIDDLGAERPTEWALEQTSTLVERRYREALPTIVTSNYGPNELAERLGREDAVIGKRIVSRLIEDAIKIEVRGRDRRLAAA